MTPWSEKFVALKNHSWSQILNQKSTMGMQKRSKNLKKPLCLGQKNVHFFYCTWNRGKNLSYLREYRKFGCCVTLSCVLLMQGPLINFNLPSVSLGGPECQCRSQGTKDLPFGSKGEWQRKQSVPPSWHEKTQIHKLHGIVRWWNSFPCARERYLYFTYFLLSPQACNKLKQPSRHLVKIPGTFPRHEGKLKRPTKP